MLSVCFIVRNNEDTIRPCLSSIAPWVDEIIVVDTGSTDRTSEIAQEIGAKVSSFPWCDDFSAARNISLERASGDWLMWMDSDDTISEENGRRLQELARRPVDEAPMSYIMQVHCPDSSDGESVTVVDHVKMFRNHPEIRFEGRIHEQVLPAIRRLGGEVEWTDIFVEHTGSDQTREGRQLKYERDLKLLSLELKDHPDHPFALFNLGMTYADMEDFERAIPPLIRSVEVAGPDESHLRKAYALLIGSLMQANRIGDAQHWCALGRELFPEDVELTFRDGILQHQLGNFDASIESYKAVLVPHESNYFSSMDSGITGYKARHNLALVYCDAGDLRAAENEWRQVVNESPTFEAGWSGLVDCLSRQGNYAEAKKVVEQLAETANSEHEAELMIAQIAESEGDMTRARNALLNACERLPSNVAVLQALCKFLFERGPVDAALAAQSKLNQLVPNDGAVLHNLATLYFQIGCVSSATRLYKESIKMRPDSMPTYLQ
ncbi:glycosyltransferase, partial [Planctomycetota bacterium]